MNEWILNKLNLDNENHVFLRKLRELLSKMPQSHASAF